LHANPEVIALQFGLDALADFKPSFNIAPAASTLVVRKTGEVVGMIYAGNGSETFACPITDVLAALD